MTKYTEPAPESQPPAVDEKVKRVAAERGKKVPVSIDFHLHGKKIINNADNVRLMIENWDKCPYQFRYNTLTHLPEIKTRNIWIPLQDKHLQKINSELRNRYPTTGTLSKDSLIGGTYDVSYQSIYDPIQEFIDSVSDWPRNPPLLSTWLIDTFDVEDTEFNRVISRLTILGAAKRLLQPGCKFDTMLILRSDQGTAKTSFVQHLCPRPEWFTSSVNMKMDDKTIIERTRNKTLVEIPELKNFKEADTEHIKDFISRTQDSARPAWGRFNEERPRQFIFIGTTNSKHYLKDSENRRFWDIEVRKYLTDQELEHFKEKVKPQLWNEAIKTVQENPDIDVKLPRKFWATAARAQRARVDMMVEDWQHIPRLLSRCWRIPSKHISRIFYPAMANDLLLGLLPSGPEKRQMGIALRRCGWESGIVKVNGKVIRHWIGPKPEDWSEHEQYRLIKEYLESHEVEPGDIDLLKPTNAQIF